jgi:osomolarity two-component system phosphorelay intermediate protein YPD1
VSESPSCSAAALANVGILPRDKKDLADLSSLGHFLKGSSATLGLTKIKEACEKIQNYGGKRSATGEEVVDKEDDYFVDKIKGMLPQLKIDYADAQRRLKDFYGEEEA